MTEKEHILTQDLRESLKDIIQDEIQKIPEILDSLQPKDKLNMIIKLMPFVCPKVQNVSMATGEPMQFGIF